MEEVRGEFSEMEFGESKEVIGEVIGQMLSFEVKYFKGEKLVIFLDIL